VLVDSEKPTMPLRQTLCRRVCVTLELLVQPRWLLLVLVLVPMATRLHRQWL
jgi:hypothetical protein